MSDETGPLVLIETASTDPSNPPVIIECPNRYPFGPGEREQYRPATEDEYAAYVAYWDRYYDELDADEEN